MRKKALILWHALPWIFLAGFMTFFSYGCAGTPRQQIESGLATTSKVCALVREQLTTFCQQFVPTCEMGMQEHCDKLQRCRHVLDGAKSCQVGVLAIYGGLDLMQDSAQP